MGFLDDVGDFFSDPVSLIFPTFGAGLTGSISGILGSNKTKMPDLPPAPVAPSASDAAVKAARAMARKRAAEQVGLDDTILTGSLGIAPGLRPTLG